MKASATILPHAPLAAAAAPSSLKIAPDFPLWVIPLPSLLICSLIFGSEWLLQGTHPGLAEFLTLVGVSTIPVAIWRRRRHRLLHRLRAGVPASAGSGPILAGIAIWKLPEDESAVGVAVLSPEKLTFFSGLLWDVPKISIPLKEVASVSTKGGQMELRSSPVLNVTWKFVAVDSATWKRELDQFITSPAAV